MSVNVKRLNKAAVIFFVIAELFLLIGVIASIIALTSLSPEGGAPDAATFSVGITCRLISDIGASVFLVIGLIIQNLVTEKYDYYAKTNYYLQWIIAIFLILNFSLICIILALYIFYHLLRKRSLYLKSYKTI